MNISLHHKSVSGTLLSVKRYLTQHYDIAIVAVMIPLVSALMWYLGRVSPDYATDFSLGTFMINAVYTTFIVVVTKMLVSGMWSRLSNLSLLARLGAVLSTALLTYFILHTAILKVIEHKAGTLLLIILYAIGASLVIAMVFLFISKELSGTSGKKVTFLRVSLRGKTVALSTYHVRIIETKDQLTNVVDHSGTTYLSSQSLVQIEKSLNPELYFRTNRQQIVHFGAVVKWERQANKTIKVWAEGRKEPLTVSRSRAATWNSWLTAKTDAQK